MSEELSFEKAMENLEKIVQRLEEGDVPLEEAIEIYKEGMGLSKLCHEKIRKVESELATVLTEEGEVEFTLPKEAKE
ncbi:exodeoxyribonuclease VII small subunit [Bacillus coahuilensis m2-6]|uniref:Exodeoxyribonuclease 7 small subunit n=1 Tax=Bacillus coahuilensis p1.1.43 TaxID=1150625 RepID=A0A147K7Q1_9BACI|nr:exodeoxyribonuclease VII small subunit [Bacillus coahuilensis]KUP06171.1 exodeoxyribonuclease VII small subunit [Bacillus coahuilensis p1.1.43]KUP07359.1 exodeoxyribonuclease VII small subunit [Bacillus coahuilensis m2-6]